MAGRNNITVLTIEIRHKNKVANTTSRLEDPTQNTGAVLNLEMTNLVFWLKQDTVKTLETAFQDGQKQLGRWNSATVKFLKAQLGLSSIFF